MPERPMFQAIRAARVEHRLTQEELAARVGVSQGTVSFWERGLETPTVEHPILRVDGPIRKGGSVCIEALSPS